MAQEINVMVGGEAGQGVQSAGHLLARALARWGYHVFADQDYESRVRGGHNFFRVRAGEAPAGGIKESVDVLIAFNTQSIELHRSEVAKGGVILYDGEKHKGLPPDGLVSVPTERLATESAGDRLMENTVALGAALGLLGYDMKRLAALLRDTFKGEAAEKNVKAAQAGYDFALKLPPGTCARKLKALVPVQRLVMSGAEAMAVGAIAAGCKFMAAYPMTPATPIMEYFAAHAREHDLVMVPAEDEIAAVNMTVGAAYGGVRAMTATSGGGFCLMTEGVGLAGMTETPLVVVEGQRPGPAIGLPTRTEQGDLDFVLHAGFGDFPRAVLAPVTVEESFWAMVKAFNLADKYQMPVLVLTDHHLTSSYATVEPFDLSKVSIDRGLLYSGDRPAEYKRHAYTDSGVSPRAFPGKTQALVVTDSDEHDEAGHLIEDAGTRALMVRKRLRKLAGVTKEIAPPRLYGRKKADTLLVGWGSTFGALKEATDILRKNGGKVSLLHLSEIWPFPAEEVADHMSNAQRTYVVESNATGQLAHLIRRETGRQVDGTILKFDGRPFTAASIAEAVRKEGC